MRGHGVTAELSVAGLVISAPKCPYCPSAPHYKFTRKEIYKFFVAWKCMAQINISGHGGSRGTRGGINNSDQEKDCSV
jgi:hypothetical protein